MYNPLQAFLRYQPTGLPLQNPTGQHITPLPNKIIPAKWWRDEIKGTEYELALRKKEFEDDLAY